MNTKRNTVHRVNAPDTTEGTKRRNAEIAAQKREDRKRDTKYIGAPTGKSVPAMTREQYRELVSGRGGNGDPDAMLGERMNPLVLAAGCTSPVAAAAMAMPAVLQARKDIKEMGVNIVDDPDAIFNLAMLGMMLYGPKNVDPKMLAKAKAMQGSRNWSELTRAEKLKIKKETGLEKISGATSYGFGRETPTDPVLKPRVAESFVKWGKDGASAFPRDQFGGDFGPLERNFNRHEAIDALGDNKIDITLKASPSDSRFTYKNPGARGALADVGPLDTRIILTENAGKTVPDVQSVAIHELQHILTGRPSQLEFRVPYGSRPTEIVSHSVQARSSMPASKRATTLVEESYPGLKTWGEDVFIEAHKDQKRAMILEDVPIPGHNYEYKPLNQDAKGGESADVRAATKGGDGGNETSQVKAPVQGAPAQTSDGGPRIVINPSTFRNEKDALCVAYNEALRIVMEENGFDPVSEPTDAQRKFFADTAYADDELMLRRTILARICVFDTSVKDPTDEQLEEAVEFLETVMEIGAPQNSEEQSVVQRAHDVIARTLQARPRGREAGGAAGTPASRGDTVPAPASSGTPTEEGLSEIRTTSGTPGTGEPGAPGTPDAGT